MKNSKLKWIQEKRIALGWKTLFKNLIKLLCFLLLLQLKHLEKSRKKNFGFYLRDRVGMLKHMNTCERECLRYLTSISYQTWILKLSMTMEMGRPRDLNIRRIFCLLLCLTCFVWQISFLKEAQTISSLNLGGGLCLNTTAFLCCCSWHEKLLADEISLEEKEIASDKAKVLNSDLIQYQKKRRMNYLWSILVVLCVENEFKFMILKKRSS